MRVWGSGGGEEIRVCRPYGFETRNRGQKSELTNPAPIKSYMSYMSSKLSCYFF